jgi:hypothetical protein
MNLTPKNINIVQQNRRVDTEEKLVNYILTQLGDGLITVDVSRDQILFSIDETFDKFTRWAYDAQQHAVFIIETSSGVHDYILDDRILDIYDMNIIDTTTSYGSGGGINGSWQGMPLGQVIGAPLYVPYVSPDGSSSSLETGASGAPYGAGASGVAGGISSDRTDGGNDGNIEGILASWANAEMMQNIFAQSVAYNYNTQNHILRIFDEINGPIMIEAAMIYVPNPMYDMAYGHPWIKEYSLNLVKKRWGENIAKFSTTLVGGSTLNYDRIISEAQEALDKLDEDLLNKYSPAFGIFSA